MKKLAFATMLILAGFSACKNPPAVPGKDPQVAQKDTTQMAAVVYQCPMDCEKGKTYDKPGQCPKCKMDLEKK